MRSPTNIVRHEFIGLDVVVVDANNKNLVGIKGEIVDETKHSFVINTVNGKKRIIKSHILCLTFLNERIQVNGDLLNKSPDKRQKQKVRNKK